MDFKKKKEFFLLKKIKNGRKTREDEKKPLFMSPRGIEIFRKCN